MSDKEDLQRGVVMVCDALVNKADALQWSERQCVESSVQINQLNCKLAVAEARAERAVAALKQITIGASPDDDHDALTYQEIEDIGMKALAELTTEQE
jgi:hypothetical protein